MTTLAKGCCMGMETREIRVAAILAMPNRTTLYGNEKFLLSSHQSATQTATNVPKKKSEIQSALPLTHTWLERFFGYHFLACFACGHICFAISISAKFPLFLFLPSPLSRREAQTYRTTIQFSSVHSVQFRFVSFRSFVLWFYEPMSVAMWKL